MNEVDRRRRSFKRRLGLTGMGCCGGATWGLRPTTMSVRDDEQEHQEQQPQVEVVINMGGTLAEQNLDPGCPIQIPAMNSGMNLATALSLERHIRATDNQSEREIGELGSMAPETPARVSLMKLLEETAEEKESSGGGEGNDTMCCVCMGRKKGAAFIPCGHAFCRVCSRELWLNRGSCPLCNRPILEILDIF